MIPSLIELGTPEQLTLEPFPNTMRVIFSVAVTAIMITSMNAQFGPAVPISPATAWVNETFGVDLDLDGREELLTHGLNSRGMFHYDAFTESFDYVSLGTVGSIPTQVVDINVDGLPDLVDPTIPCTYRLNNGNLDFSPSANIPGLNVNYQYIQFADIDNDGDADLLALLNGGTDKIIVRRNNGTGQFGSNEELIVANNAKFRIVDFNGDGLLDLIVRLATTPSPTWQLYEQASDGTFSFATTITAMSTCHEWVIEDVDLDGLPDLLVPSPTDCTQLQWRRNLGNFAFDAGIPLPAAISSSDLAYMRILFTDVDSDGDKDMIMTKGIHADLLVNEGGLVFSIVPEWISEGPDTQSPVQKYLSLFDHDNDGTKELVYTQNKNVRVYDLPGDGSLAFELLLNEQFGYPYEPAFGDLDGNGYTDVLNINMYGWLTAYMNYGDRFKREVILMQEISSIWSVEIDDFDSDGVPDILVHTDQGVKILWNQGDLQFLPQLVAPASWTNGYNDRVIAQDLDGDGFLEILTESSGSGEAIRILRNNGNTDFVTATGTSMTVGPFHIMGFFDRDDDGSLDIIIREDDSFGQVYWMRNLGGVTFAPRQPIHPMMGRMQIMDIDGDGLQDMCFLGTVSVYPSSIVTYVRNLGGGNYAPPDTLVPPDIYLGNSNIGDIDNDGDPDIIITTSGGTTGFLMLNDGTGQFGPMESFSMPAIDGSYSVTHMVDMDDDGDRDLVYLTQTNEQYVYLENWIGDPYRAEGIVFGDLNGNGTRDPGEPNLPWATVVSSPASYIAFSDTNGSFSIHADEGTIQITSTVPNDLWQLSTAPAMFDVVLSADIPMVEGLDFGYAPVLDSSAIEIVTTVAPGPCGGTTSLYITYTNTGTRIESGSIYLDLDDARNFISSEPIPLSVGTTIEWQFQDLQHFETRVLHAVVSIPGVDQMNTTLVDEVVIQTTGTDPQEFLNTHEVILACAYDPNDKNVYPEGYGVMNALDIATEHVEYQIRFQNTGTAPATDVMLRDQLHPALDRTDIHVLGYSHPPSEIAVEPGGELVVRFNGIMLPDSSVDATGSQGYIKFRIGLHEGLPHLTTVPNQAGIYFDLNPPIITNTTGFVLVDCDLWTPEIMLTPDGSLEATVGDEYQWYLNGEILPSAVQHQILQPQQGIYTVAVLSEHGCLSESGPFNTITTSVNAPGSEGVAALVPNPVADQAFLILQEILEPHVIIEVLDMLGRQILTIPSSGTDRVIIETGGLATGTYFVRINKDGARPIILRMMKE